MGRAVATAAEVTARLRAPDGCPWDREQTHASLRPFALEEAQEVVDAIESGDPAKLREELGDLLLQVLLHSQIAQESGRFDLADVADGLSAKLVRRHPHVFEGKAIKGDVLSQWQGIKEDEKREAAAALRAANERFARRLVALADRARAEGRDLASYDADEIWKMWEATA